MGGPVRSGREALRALEEAVAIIRAFWSGERTIAFEGEHYAVRGLHPGPPPAHRIEIWLGVGKPRSLALTGRLADGWCPRIRRVYNVSGAILDESTRGRLEGPPEHWVETLTRFATELGFDTFVFWPSDDHRMQLERFAQEVIPELRQNT
jgi:alkanesulfonate monooxygenase SsuD/methylene tetrahydromethanopterin reductase-like flavin-dependent oxidoreductase (luciferase family)